MRLLNPFKPSNRTILDLLCRMEQNNVERHKILMATQAELVADLKAVSDQQKKTLTEIQSVQAATDALKTKVAELEAIIAAGGTIGQELVDAVADVKAQAQLVDDAIPDLPAPPTT